MTATLKVGFYSLCHLPLITNLQVLIYTYVGILCSLKKENLAIGDNVDEHDIILCEISQLFRRTTTA